jgi:hypothetical protein
MVRRQLLSLLVFFWPVISAFAQQGTAPATGKPVSAPAVQDESKAAVSDEAQTAALAKAAQNPIANLISFPLQVLVNNVWSVAGSEGRPAVNQMLLQYFVSTTT